MHYIASYIKKSMFSVLIRVGPVYGCKAMKGYLRSKGIRAGQRQIAEVLPSVCLLYHQQRLNRAEQQINPIPYTASYFRHKLHIDQNEKLVMFGVTHIATVDGFSNMVVGFVTMPVKNNVEIYKELFCPIVMNCGLWDQLRVDQGKE